MQEFWVPHDKTDLPVPPGGFRQRCVKAYLPKICPHCSRQIVIYVRGDDDNAGGMELGSCKHVDTYPDIWSMRVIQPTQQSVVKIVRTGPVCCGKCGNFNDYAEPNQADGTFVCYSCRH